MSIEEIANELNQLAYRLDSMRNYQATTEGLKTTKALREAATILQSNHNEKLNTPLTLDEMLEMEGELVWVETPEKSDDCNGLSMVKLSAPWKPGGLKPHVLIVSKNGDRNYAELLMVGFGGKIYRCRPKEETK